MEGSFSKCFGDSTNGMGGTQGIFSPAPENRHFHVIGIPMVQLRIRNIMRASRAGFFCRLLLTTNCLSAGSLISAQNLIPNPGFEEYTTDCSSGVGYTQLSQWTYPECSFWSEMYAECNNGPAPWAGVPTNFEGEQEAHSGGAYCGVITYNSLAFQGNQRYYTSIRLATPPVEGE